MLKHLNTPNSQLNENELLEIRAIISQINYNIFLNILLFICIRTLFYITVIGLVFVTGGQRFRHKRNVNTKN